ncbi:MAG: chloride channel protein [Planctomycetes bacterium]|nr:chloride channel protein [Planctomycetota bacterium]
MQKPKGLPLRAFQIFLLAAVIGVAGGFLGSKFLDGLEWLQNTLTQRRFAVDPEGVLHPAQSLPKAISENLAWWQTLLIPTAGGLVAGLVLLMLRGKKPPFGLADLVVLVQLRKGTIHLRESLVQTLSSACTIGSGGSIGREGANSQIAATIAALVARWAQLGSRPRAVLLGCGVAAGMATSYNAPITGALFVMEVVLGNFAMDVFAPIVVASVLATIVRGELRGTSAHFQEMADHVAKLPWELVGAAGLLGVACGVGGIVFRTALASGRRLFARLPSAPPLRLALGGLLVGAIGITAPHSWGNGFDVIDELARHTPALGMVMTLFLWKLVATVATIGSGGLGGVFTPNLVIGAAFGAVFAHGLDFITPLTDKEIATFVFVGMAGLTAATMHAPVTAVLLVYELTGHYELTLPVMLCSIVASIMASLLDEDSYYTAAIRLKGEQLPGGIEDLAIRSTYVRDVQRTDTLVVRDTATFQEVMQALGTHRGDTLYVQDAAGTLIGRIELQDVKGFLNDPSLTNVVIAADMTRPPVTAQPDQSVASLMPMFDDPELREVAVVSAGPAPKLLGRVRHQDVLSMLGNEVLGQQRRNHRLALAGEDLALPVGYELATVPVPDAWTGHAVDALPPTQLQGLVVVLAIRPGGRASDVVAATSDLVLEADWRVVVLGQKGAIRRLREDAESADA